MKDLCNKRISLKALNQASSFTTATQMREKQVSTFSGKYPPFSAILGRVFPPATFMEQMILVVAKLRYEEL